ncbi:MAG TPA: zf-HC2 domain-containing protein [Mycobacterium sp.]|nr:zf-HC2 domain-containing protein [Mycobacterium sp.]
MWDAAYVLGSLSYADRQEFEAHMAGCASCRDAVAALSGIPALLSRLDPEQVAAIAVGLPPAGGGGDTSGTSSLPPEILPSMLATVRRRRRRSRLVTWSCGAAAAAVLAVGVLVGVQGHSPTSVPTPPQASAPAPPQPGGSAQPMAQVGTTALASTVSLSSQQWGTFISMNCVCLAPLNGPHDTLAMVVVDRDGNHTQLATWVANPGHTATPAGSIALRVDQIAAVQVVSADNSHVLLERSL